jgi:uncharacterized protein YjbI with pentapeptide repeats
VYLTGVHLTGVHLTGVPLTGVYLTGVHLTGVYLTGVHLRSRHSVQGTREGDRNNDPNDLAPRFSIYPYPGPEVTGPEIIIRMTQRQGSAFRKMGFSIYPYPHDLGRHYRGFLDSV